MGELIPLLPHTSQPSRPRKDPMRYPNSYDKALEATVTQR